MTAKDENKPAESMSTAAVTSTPTEPVVAAPVAEKAAPVTASKKKAATTAAPAATSDAAPVLPKGQRPGKLTAGVLTEAEEATIVARARVQVEDKKKKKAEEALLAREIARLAREEGVVEGPSHLDDMVEIQMVLAEPRVNSALTVDGQHYFHGQKYTVSRREANSLMEAAQRLDQYTSREIRGEQRMDFYQKPKDLTLRGIANQH